MIRKDFNNCSFDRRYAHAFMKFFGHFFYIRRSKAKKLNSFLKLIHGIFIILWVLKTWRNGMLHEITNSILAPN